MKLEQRSFSSQVFRPHPEVLINEDIKVFAFLTAWGDQDLSQKTLQFLFDGHHGSFSDEEKTIDHPYIKSLSPEENALRSLILNCNEWVFKEQNGNLKKKVGYELVYGYLREGKLIFAQIGQPFIYLDRKHLPLQVIGQNLDFSGLFGGEKRLPPLPSQLMGLFPDTHFSVFTFPIKKEDRLIFISRDFVKNSLLDMPRQERNLETLSRALTSENEEQPFWIGILSF